MKITWKTNHRIIKFSKLSSSTKTRLKDRSSYYGGARLFPRWRANSFRDSTSMDENRAGFSAFHAGHACQRAHELLTSLYSDCRVRLSVCHLYLTIYAASARLKRASAYAYEFRGIRLMLMVAVVLLAIGWACNYFSQLHFVKQWSVLLVRLVLFIVLVNVTTNVDLNARSNRFLLK